MGCRSDGLVELIDALDYAKDYKVRNMHPNWCQYFFPAFTEIGTLLLRALDREGTTG